MLSVRAATAFVFAQKMSTAASSSTASAATASASYATALASNESLLNFKRAQYSGKPKRELDFRNKLVLAPMVRVGVLPFRLLALEHGADIVYSEELIAQKLINTKRFVREDVGICEYIDPNGKPVYQTCDFAAQGYPDAIDVLQIGTSSADHALRVAQHMYQDYDALDINCGCPKHFSMAGKMGAALLKDPERLRDILTTLTRNIDKPITCKIRLLDKLEDTIELVKMIEGTGVKALAIHGRYIPQRPREAAHLEQIKQVIEGANLQIPVIANGDVFKHSEFAALREKTGCSSLMIARGALWNPYVFESDEPDFSEIASKLIVRGEFFGMHPNNTKYILQKIFELEPKDERYQLLNRSSTYQGFRSAFGLDPNLCIYQGRNDIKKFTFSEKSSASGSAAAAAATEAACGEGDEGAAAAAEEASDEPSAKKVKREAPDASASESNVQ